MNKSTGIFFVGVLFATASEAGPVLDKVMGLVRKTHVPKVISAKPVQREGNTFLFKVNRESLLFRTQRPIQMGDYRIEDNFLTIPISRLKGEKSATELGEEYMPPTVRWQDLQVGQKPIQRMNFVREGSTGSLTQGLVDVKGELLYLHRNVHVEDNGIKNLSFELELKDLTGLNEMHSPTIRTKVIDTKTGQTWENQQTLEIGSDEKLVAINEMLVKDNVVEMRFAVENNRGQVFNRTLGKPATATTAEPSQVRTAVR